MGMFIFSQIFTSAASEMPHSRASFVAGLLQTLSYSPSSVSLILLSFINASRYFVRSAPGRKVDGSPRWLYIRYDQCGGGKVNA